MATNYTEFIHSISPGWLRGYWGKRFVGYVHGVYADIVAEGASQAIKASWLRSNTSPADALPGAGRDRILPRYAIDTDATYRERLLGAWAAYLFAGNEISIEGQLNEWGLTNVSTDTVLRGWWFEAPPDLANWSRFVVIIEQPHTWTGTPPTFGSGGTYGASYVYGTDVTYYDARAMWSIVDKWKSGHEICPHIVVNVAGTHYNKPSTVYGGGAVYGSATTFILNHP